MVPSQPSPSRRRPPRSRRRRLRFRLGRALFVLPNLFTCSSIFCGFYAIVLCSAPSTPAGLYRAGIAICFAIFFDMADGRVARLTATQSEFGVQLDSLADIVSFGVAPAVLAYRFCLHRLGPVGVVLAFAYIACGAMRLARFNVLAARSQERPKPPSDQRRLPFAGAPESQVDAADRFFLGLPIPLAAGVVASAVMYAQRSARAAMLHRYMVAAAFVTLSLLMVSNVRYRSFKQVRPSGPILSFAALLLAIFVGLARFGTPALGGLVFFLAYVSLGLVEAAGRRLWRRP